MSDRIQGLEQILWNLYNSILYGLFKILQVITRTWKGPDNILTRIF